MPVSLARTCEAAITIDAPVKEVWSLVSDVTRVGEWSVECRGCEWIADATGPTVGARFRGRNRRNTTRWTRTCEVLELDEPHRFQWRTLPTRLLPDSTEWTFRLDAEGERTLLTETMQILHIPPVYEQALALMLPQHRDRTSDLQRDLQRIKERLEAEPHQGA